MSYPVPARTIRIEQEIRRSRFIATVGRAEHKAQVVALIEAVRAEFPDAAHHCWAYVAGPPGNTLDIGMSDAGEPHGTAGRPMLNVLQQKGIGEIVAVVTRYFGGVKLGTGGLARAYAGAVQQAIEALPLMERVDYRPGRIVVPYALENTVRHLLETMHLPVVDAAYGDRVVLHVRVPAPAQEELERMVRSQTMGEGQVEWRYT
jgi:uncharacterized YigZ family protein